jgi:type IV pilus assembly protein PilY1
MNVLKYKRLTQLEGFICFKSHRNIELVLWRNAISRFCFCFFMLCEATSAYADPSQMPLFLTTPAKGNLLVILDNSNSMDEDASGAAVGSNSPSSKSEIARSVTKNMISSYTNRINMGLMTYKLAATSDQNIHNSPYDASYNPANYDPAFTGARDSTTKRYRIPNLTSPGDYIYYNVGLPFYSNSNEGNAFCYSTTANAFNNGEDPNSGPWDTYRCFHSKTSSSDALNDAAGYSNFMGSFTFSPTDSDLAQGIVDFGKQIAWNYVGPTYFANSSPGRGFLDVPISPLDTAHGNTIKDRLACNVPTTPAPCTASGIKNAGLTPIEGTLLTAKDYFGGSWTVASEGYGTSVYPLPTSCGKNFVILITDGLPSTDKNGNIVANPTAAISAAAAAATDLKASGVETYVVGFALPYGTDPATLNTIATAGGTGAAYSASDLASLTSVLDTIFHDILSKSNSFSSVASNSTRLDSGTQVYQAKFDATDWSGQLVAYKVNTSTGALTPVWEVSTLLPAHASRNIYTYNPSAAAGFRGISFLWDDLTTTPSGTSQQDYLNKLSGVNDGKGKLRVDWLRGDDAKEQKNTAGIFRNRTNVLGDIINSDPVYVGSEDYGYGALSGTEGSSYSAFRASSAYISRRPMLYAGANDGMLHGFDARENTGSITTGGTEIFAYVPNALFPELSKLTAPTYAHQYYVDGISVAGDVYDGSAWHTLLAGATGAGGRAVFALDVTNPDAFGTGSALWEFTNADDADLGYTLAQPLVVRMQNGDWAVIVANGYNSDNGHAVLFVLNAKTYLPRLLSIPITIAASILYTPGICTAIYGSLICPVLPVAGISLAVVLCLWLARHLERPAVPLGNRSPANLTWAK